MKDRKASCRFVAVLKMSRYYSRRLSSKEGRERSTILYYTVDLAKVFNAVSHNSIEKGLRRKGIPDQLRGTIMEMHKNSKARITVGGRTSKEIKINARVKQGLPMSPLLLNLIIDKLLEKMQKLNMRTMINNKLLCCMAFADDLVLITEERICNQILIKQCKYIFDRKGLIANAGKHASLGVVAMPKKKSMKSMKKIAKHHQSWGDEQISPSHLKIF